MLGQQHKTDDQAGWINRTSPASSAVPIITLALGVFANFAWVALVFWAISYWIVWR